MNPLLINYYIPSVLWHCWLGNKKGIGPVKTLGERVGEGERLINY